MARKTKAEIILSCGRYFLLLNGFAVAMEGDVCRDGDLRDEFGGESWTIEMMQRAAGQEVTGRLTETS